MKAPLEAALAAGDSSDARTPPSLLPAPPPSLWEPSKVFGPARPPPQDDRSQLAYQAELAFRQSHQSEFNNRDYSNSSKKLRARRTIDYFGEMGKWNLVRSTLLTLLVRRLGCRIEHGEGRRGPWPLRDPDQLTVELVAAPFVNCRPPSAAQGPTACSIHALCSQRSRVYNRCTSNQL